MEPTQLQEAIVATSGVQWKTGKWLYLLKCGGLGRATQELQLAFEKEHSEGHTGLLQKRTLFGVPVFEKA